jgi:hypothetical protein
VNIAGRARSRAQRSSDRSLARREQEQRLREEWPTEKIIPQIADELQTTVSNIKGMRQRARLPPRPRGRPSKK